MARGHTRDASAGPPWSLGAVIVSLPRVGKQKIRQVKCFLPGSQRGRDVKEAQPGLLVPCSG